MSQAKTSPCTASYAVSRAYPATAKAFVMDVVSCPECFRPVRLKLMGASKFPGRYVGIPKHERLATPKERAASDRIVAALAKPSHQPTTGS